MRRESGDFRKATLCPSWFRGDWLGAAAGRGLLGICVACCSVHCQQQSGCFLHPLSKDCGRASQHQGPWTVGQTHTSVPRIQVKLKAALALGRLTDWEAPGLGHSGTKPSGTRSCSSRAVWPGQVCYPL